MVQRQEQKEGHALKEIIARMKKTRRDARARISERARKSQEDVKITDVRYIDGYVETNK